MTIIEAIPLSGKRVKVRDGKGQVFTGVLTASAFGAGIEGYTGGVHFSTSTSLHNPASKAYWDNINLLEVLPS